MHKPLDGSSEVMHAHEWEFKSERFVTRDGRLPEKKTIEFGTPNDSISLIQFATNLQCLLAEL